jgi:hypothetical protein
LCKDGGGYLHSYKGNFRIEIPRFIDYGIIFDINKNIQNSGIAPCASAQKVLYSRSKL